MALIGGGGGYEAWSDDTETKRVKKSVLEPKNENFKKKTRTSSLSLLLRSSRGGGINWGE